MLELSLEKTCHWLTTGQVTPDILAEDFQFISPFHQTKDKAKFLEDFQNRDDYKNRILSRIQKFDPIITCISPQRDYFTIVLQYYTDRGYQVWETVLGKVNQAGLLTEMRSIYDLALTKQALGL